MFVLKLVLLLVSGQEQCRFVCGRTDLLTSYKLFVEVCGGTSERRKSLLFSIETILIATIAVEEGRITRLGPSSERVLLWVVEHELVSDLIRCKFKRSCSFL